MTRTDNLSPEKVTSEIGPGQQSRVERKLAGPPSLIPALTGLRAAAALFVLLFHFREFPHDRVITFGPLTGMVDAGFLGVDVFFVLSGFIMWHVYGAGFAKAMSAEKYTGFLVNRLARLYPLHALTLCAMLAEFWFAKRYLHLLPHHPEHFTVLSVASNLLMVHAWFPATGAPNGPAWSISAEWFAYLLFPFAAWLAFRVQPAFRVAFTCAIFILPWLYDTPSHLEQVSMEFAAGMMIASCNSVWNERWNVRYLSIVAVVLFAGGLMAGVTPGIALIMPTASILILGLAQSRDVCAAFFALPSVVFLGEISYSIYMCHWAVWSVMKNLSTLCDRHGISPYILISAALAVTILISAGTWKYAELPWRRRIRAAYSRHHSFHG